MKRREFIKSTLGLAAAAALAPSWLRADVVPNDDNQPLPLAEVVFDANIFQKNDAQTIIIFLSGGMSDVVGNIGHIQTIIDEGLSGKAYPSGGLTATVNGFWKEAGGDYLEQMLANGDLNLFRTCYQTDPMLAHGINQSRYMHGNGVGYNSGIVSTLMHVLNQNSMIQERAVLTNVAIDGSDYRLIEDGGTSQMLPSFLRAASISRDLSNPYNYAMTTDGLVSVGDTTSTELLNSANYSDRLTALSQRHNLFDALSDIFNRREELSDFLDDVINDTLPVQYPGTLDGKKLEAAMRILTKNPDTKIVSMLGGFSSWDDHSNAIVSHSKRASELFEAIYAAVQHMAAVGKENINIVLFGDFGRNMNLNSAAGWDHGNNQVVYWFGGKKFFNSLGVVGETDLDVWIPKARLYTKPKDTSYQFSPYSIASTIYALYGVTNPEILTGGYKPIDPSGYTDADGNSYTSFLKG
ncbi:DUF1501 domain-containing protein [Hydrogenimonas sp.]